MKIRLVVALVGLAIGFAVPAIAQDKNTVDAEVPSPTRQSNLPILERFPDAVLNGTDLEVYCLPYWRRTLSLPYPCAPTGFPEKFRKFSLGASLLLCGPFSEDGIISLFSSTSEFRNA
jgi:hypothetical protein